MKEYLDLAKNILKNGNTRGDRTGTGTKSLFGPQMEFDLQEGFPLITTKKMAIKSVISELLWFLEGSTNERRLAEIHHSDKSANLIGKRTVWTDNADNQGVALGYTNTDTIKELGPVYSKQWRNTYKDGGYRIGDAFFEVEEIDQIADVIKSIKENPDSRRHIVSAWNVAEIDEMALPPCHCLFQFYVNNGKLDCKMFQRSADLFLGVPFNIASYALLTMMIAQVCDLKPGRFIHTFGDVHIYSTHMEQINEQLKNEPESLPQMIIDPTVKSINDFKMDSFTLENYTCHQKITGKMAI